MRRVHWLHVVAVLLAIGGGVAGWLLVSFRGLVPYTMGDCISPNGDCFTMAHPYLWPGILVWIISAVGSIILWRVGSKLAAGLSPAGFRG
jgi:hypothetical protein